MLRRKIEKTLLDWKNTPNHKPLILKGCRQCGKTYSVLEFAKKNYAHTVYLNFFENPQFVSVFSGSLEVDNITMLLSALMGQDAVFESGKTLLVLDEIQPLLVQADFLADGSRAIRHIETLLSQYNGHFSAVF